MTQSRLSRHVVTRCCSVLHVAARHTFQTCRAASDTKTQRPWWNLGVTHPDTFPKDRKTFSTLNWSDQYEALRAVCRGMYQMLSAENMQTGQGPKSQWLSGSGDGGQRHAALPRSSLCFHNRRSTCFMRQNPQSAELS